LDTQSDATGPVRVSGTLLGSLAKYTIVSHIWFSRIKLPIVCTQQAYRMERTQHDGFRYDESSAAGSNSVVVDL